MKSQRRWSGSSGFGRIRARGAPQVLSAVYYVTAVDLTADRCTVTGSHLTRAAADAAAKLEPGAVVFEARAKLVAGLRAWHAAGIAWAFDENTAGKPTVRP